MANVNAFTPGYPTVAPGYQTYAPNALAPGYQTVAPAAQAPVAGNASIPTGYVPAVAAPAANANAGGTQGGGFFQDIKDTFSSVISKLKGNADAASSELATKGYNPNTGEFDAMAARKTKMTETALEQALTVQKDQDEHRKTIFQIIMGR
jgi:hypothetical protein